MLQIYLEKNVKGKLRGAEYIVAVPTNITKVEKKAFSDIFYKSKLKPKSVLLCEKPIADAVGFGLDVSEPTGIMIVDIGADTTEISVISLGGLVLSDLLHYGGNKIDESIITYVKRKYNLVIGQKTAQAMKERLGSGVPGKTETMGVVGRDVVSGLPVEIEMSAAVVYEAIKDHLGTICNAIKMILEKTPPELSADIIDHGITLTGGGGLLHGLVHPEGGHILLIRHPKDTYEGKCPFHKNCVEGLAAGPSIEARWGKKAAELADRDEVWEMEAYYIAQAITDYILSYSPQKIILWGGVMHQEKLFGMVRKEVLNLLNGYVAHETITEHIDQYIVPPALGEDPGIMGAIKLGLDALG